MSLATPKLQSLQKALDLLDDDLKMLQDYVREGIVKVYTMNDEQHPQLLPPQYANSIDMHAQLVIAGFDDGFYPGPSSYRLLFVETASLEQLAAQRVEQKDAGHDAGGESRNSALKLVAVLAKMLYDGAEAKTKKALVLEVIRLLDSSEGELSRHGLSESNIYAMVRDGENLLKK